jgi:cytochrome c biogenesis protein CcdA
MQLTLDEELVYQPAPIPKTRIWTGRIISGLLILFFVFDCVGKFLKPAPVVEAFVQLGFPISLAPAIGTILLACTILYAIPRTSILGAVLLTGYLGGAVVTLLRAGEPLLSHVLFPVYFGVLLWLALFLRENRLREFIGLRS